MPFAPGQGIKELEKLIVQHIPRDFLMACEDACFNGDEKGRMQATSFAAGHRPSAVGQNRHFFTNEAFFEALLAHGANPTPLRGTQVVIGQLGIFNVARVSVAGHKWASAFRRGSTRKLLSQFNVDIEQLYVQSDFFAATNEPVRGTIFIVGVVDGLDEAGNAQLTEVSLALPAPHMKSFLYTCKVSDFLSLYDQPDSVGQVDEAIPKLKNLSKKQTGNDQGNN
ncbi:hypothetical protein [Massilia sp. YMA4]|uniref:hypothetical protein n=1 Tax=Massilia sp. YMA4 TaxID=1593482 RepID=UPI0015826DEC|nr:hypothetical protein [Massilia sp. YMA4]